MARPATPRYEVGRHIVIYGATGSGKSTLADRLGAVLGIGVLHLDNIRHDRGWDSVPWDEMRQRVEAFVGSHPEGWVAEGNYSRVRDVTLSHADTLISLDVPWRTSFWRLLKRTVYRARTGEPLYHAGGPHESWRQSFFSRQSILLWSITNHQHRKQTTADAIAQKPDGARVYRLTESREVEALVDAASAGDVRPL